MCGPHAGEGSAAGSGRRPLAAANLDPGGAGPPLPELLPHHHTPALLPHHPTPARYERLRPLPPVSPGLLASPSLPSHSLFLVIILYACTTLNCSQSSLRLKTHDSPEWLTGRGLHHHFDGEEIEPGKGGGKGPDSVLGQTGFGPALVCSLQNRSVLPSGRM